MNYTIILYSFIKDLLFLLQNAIIIILHHHNIKEHNYLVKDLYILIQILNVEIYILFIKLQIRNIIYYFIMIHKQMAVHVGIVLVYVHQKGWCYNWILLI